MELHQNEEEKLGNAAFIYGSVFAADMEEEMVAMFAALNGGEQSLLQGLRIDTCANRSPARSLQQYPAYCLQFKAIFLLDRKGAKLLSEMGESSMATGSAIVSVPFPYLKTVIEVCCQIVSDNFPILLSNKVKCENGPDVSIRSYVKIYNILRQLLTFSNYFLIHKRVTKRWNTCTLY